MSYRLIACKILAGNDKVSGLYYLNFNNPKQSYEKFISFLGHK